MTTLSLGGFFFVSINHVAKAGWSAGIRRVAEAMSAFIPWILLGSLFLLLGLKEVYEWSRPEVVSQEPLLQLKSAYLNIPFLIVRLLVFTLGLLLFYKKIVGQSLLQDQLQDSTQSHLLSNRNTAWSVAYILFFAILFSLFSVDLLMSLLPTWYSTIFGVYLFAGMFQSGLAFMILLLLFLKRTGVVQGYYGIDHLHDLAKFMKGMTVFWAYIAFSQFMLIWYANIPEETEFFIMRIQNGWLGISLGLLLFRFIVPFVALLPRSWKRNEDHLIVVSVLILFMQYLDLYWLVYPNFNENLVVFGWIEVSVLVGFVGLFLLVIGRFFKKYSVVAVGDPRMHESIHHHVV